jgi:hypothetical protein
MLVGETGKVMFGVACPMVKCPVLYLLPLASGY